MTRLLIYGMAILFFSSQVISQDFRGFDETTAEPHVEIYAEVKPYRVVKSSQAILTLRVFQEEGWYLYSLKNQGNHGPQPTKIEIFSNWVNPSAPANESLPEYLFDDAFQRKLMIHTQPFRLNQTFTLNSKTPPGPINLEGFLIYQICNSRVCSPLQKKLFSAPFEFHQP